MANQIHTFSLELTMKLIDKISKISRFDAQWGIIEKREGQTLKQLKEIATVRSVGASTRIEGAKMTDEQVELLIEKLEIAKLEERDEQEVAGYFEVLDDISESYKGIKITEGDLKNLHKHLLIYCEKDAWHRGDYKQVSNAVEANHPDGSKQIIFKTTEPGLPTQQAMDKLFAWYHADKETHPLVKTALFVYDFLSIHPFQDGNGRLSRLLGTLLLLKNGYNWIQFVSFEHEIESRKAEYYKVLMQTQKQRPNEKVDEWVDFFFDCLMNIQDQLMQKLKTSGTDAQLASRERSILSFLENYPGVQSSEIAKKLDIPLPTVKRILTTLVEKKLILKNGAGAGTNYMIEKASPLKTDLMFQLTNASRKKEFNLIHPSSFVEIKQIILTPLFEWIRPDEWSGILIRQGLNFKITIRDSRGSTFTQSFNLSSFNSPFYFQPVFPLRKPIHLPGSIMGREGYISEFPMSVEIELLGSVPKFDFDVMFIYDEV